MLSFNDAQSLICSFVSRIAESAPDEWSEIVHYSEFLYVDGYLDQTSIVECLSKEGRVIDFTAPFEVELDIRRAFESQKSANDSWSALKIWMNAKGLYRSKFYYDPPPHLSGDTAGAGLRLSAKDF